MKLLRLTLRDLFWLVLVAGLALGCWRAFEDRRQSQSHFESTRQVIRELVELTGVDIEQRGEEFVLVPRETRYNLLPCPGCRGVFVIDVHMERYEMTVDGETNYGWRRSGVCHHCKQRYAYVLMPQDDPGYQQWLPLSAK